MLIETHPQLAPAFCLMQFSEALAMHRLLVSSCPFDHRKTDLNPGEQAWIYLESVAYRDAVIQWCKVFDKTTDFTHWRTALGVESDRAYLELLSALRISEDEWSLMRSQVKTARDKSFAHHDANIVEMVGSYPPLSVPHEAAAFMYGKLLRAAGLRPDEMPEDLARWARSLHGTRASTVARMGLAVQTFVR